MTLASFGEFVYIYDQHGGLKIFNLRTDKLTDHGTENPFIHDVITEYSETLGLFEIWEQNQFTIVKVQVATDGTFSFIDEGHSSFDSYFALTDQFYTSGKTIYRFGSDQFVMSISGEGGILYANEEYFLYRTSRENEVIVRQMRWDGLAYYDHPFDHKIYSNTRREDDILKFYSYNPSDAQEATSYTEINLDVTLREDTHSAWSVFPKVPLAFKRSSFVEQLQEFQLSGDRLLRVRQTDQPKGIYVYMLDLITGETLYSLQSDYNPAEYFVYSEHRNSLLFSDGWELSFLPEGQGEWQRHFYRESIQFLVILENKSLSRYPYR